MHKINLPQFSRGATLFAFTALILFAQPVKAQNDSLSVDSVFSVEETAPGTSPYHVYPKIELPVGFAALVGSYFGFRNLAYVAAMDRSEVEALNIMDINDFDRSSAYLDPNKFGKMQHFSDWALNISVFSPIILGLDKSIRKDALDMAAMYLMAHAFNDALYFSVAYNIRRPRPYVYNEALPIDSRVGKGKSNSFYSGHVAFASTATFFLVKVYTDYHQIKGWKRNLLYLAAAVPPASVGYFRYKGGKHFKSDVMLGFAVGAFAGIIVPTMHRWSEKNKHLSIAPTVQGGAPGLGLVYRID